jgi:hypothetical protein
MNIDAVGSLYGASELMICFIKKIKVIRSIVAHVSMSVIISCVSNLTLSLEEMIRALFL